MTFLELVIWDSLSELYMDSFQHKQVITAIVTIKALISLQRKETHDDSDDRKKKILMYLHVPHKSWSGHCGHSNCCSGL